MAALPTWDFAGIEHWLNEQAQSGYLLNGWPGWSFIGRVPFLSLIHISPTVIAAPHNEYLLI